MNHYLFKYSIEKSKEYFINKRVSSVAVYSPSSFKIEFSNSKYGLYINLSSQNSFLFPTSRSLDVQKISDAVFLVFLKKKLPSLTLNKIEHRGLERVASFIFEDRRGSISNSFRFIIEMMDRHTNAVFSSENLEIIQAYKHTNSYRQIMPHKKYEPPVLEMPDLLLEDTKKLLLRFRHNENILGLNGNLRALVKDDNSFLKFVSLVGETFSKKEFKLYLHNKNQVYPFALSNESVEVDEDFIFENFILKPKLNEFLNRKKNLENILTKRLKSLKKRYAKVQKELDSASNYDKYRIFAENLLANPNLDTLHKNSVTLSDVYTQQQITIQLNPDITIFDNAQKYFKKFKKAKKSQERIKKRIEETEDEIKFIEQLIFDIENAEDEKELDDIKDIMIKESIVKTGSSKPKQSSYKPYEHIKIEDFDAYIGKNAKGNDYITLKLANKNDLWFHPKSRPGAHLILKNPNRLQKIDEGVKIKCAYEVAKKSKAQKGEKIEIDYTEAKYVKKPKGFKTGMVIYSNFKTVRVEKL